MTTSPHPIRYGLERLLDEIPSQILFDDLTSLASMNSERDSSDELVEQDIREWLDSGGRHVRHDEPHRRAFDLRRSTHQPAQGSRWSSTLNGVMETVEEGIMVPLLEAKQASMNIACGIANAGHLCIYLNLLIIAVHSRCNPYALDLSLRLFYRTERVTSRQCQIFASSREGQDPVLGPLDIFINEVRQIVGEPGPDDTYRPTRPFDPVNDALEPETRPALRAEAEPPRLGVRYLRDFTFMS